MTSGLSDSEHQAAWKFFYDIICNNYVIIRRSGAKSRRSC